MKTTLVCMIILFTVQTSFCGSDRTEKLRQFRTDMLMQTISTTHASILNTENQRLVGRGTLAVIYAALLAVVLSTSIRGRKWIFIILLVPIVAFYFNEVTIQDIQNDLVAYSDSLTARVEQIQLMDSLDLEQAQHYTFSRVPRDERYGRKLSIFFCPPGEMLVFYLMALLITTAIYFLQRYEGDPKGKNRNQRRGNRTVEPQRKQMRGTHE